MHTPLRSIFQAHHHTYALKENIRFALSPETCAITQENSLKIGFSRAKILFEELFATTESLLLILVLPEFSKRPRVKKYLERTHFQLVDHFQTDAWQEYYSGPTSILIVRVKKNNLRWSKLILGLIHQDFPQPKQFKINSPIFLANEETHTLFNVYDDRGCDIWSANYSLQSALYWHYTDWILPYDKPTIAAYYEKPPET